MPLACLWLDQTNGQLHLLVAYLPIGVCEFPVPNTSRTLIDFAKIVTILSQEKNLLCLFTKSKNDMPTYANWYFLHVFSWLFIVFSKKFYKKSWKTVKKRIKTKINIKLTTKKNKKKVQTHPVCARLPPPLPPPGGRPEPLPLPGGRRLRWGGFSMAMAPVETGVVLVKEFGVKTIGSMIYIWQNGVKNPIFLAKGVCLFWWTSWWRRRLWWTFDEPFDEPFGKWFGSLLFCEFWET